MNKYHQTLLPTWVFLQASPRFKTLKIINEKVYQNTTHDTHKHKKNVSI